MKDKETPLTTFSNIIQNHHITNYLAYNFSIIGLIATAITACTTILGKNVTKASIIGSVLGVVVSILVMFAAKTVKDHYKA